MVKTIRRRFTGGVLSVRGWVAFGTLALGTETAGCFTGIKVGSVFTGVLLCSDRRIFSAEDELFDGLELLFAGCIFFLLAALCALAAF